MTESFFTTLKTAAESVGISVTDNQCEKLYKFYETVVEYNKNVNLTAITDEKEFIVKHIVDSISAAKFIKENAAVVDIGAGAGVPELQSFGKRPGSPSGYLGLQVQSCLAQWSGNHASCMEEHEYRAFQRDNVEE